MSNAEITPVPIAPQRPRSDIPCEIKLSHLSRILNSGVLSRSAQLRRLLQWLGDNEIACTGSRSEYEVGVQALGRSEQFDPQTDSIVRKEIRRLRGKLEVYYRTEGRNDKLQVRFVGPYDVAFAQSEPAEPGSAPGSESVLVLPPLSVSETSAFADLFYDELLLGLAATPGLSLIARTTARKYHAQAGDVREIAGSCGADYVIESAIHPKGDQAVVTMWLVNGATGRLQSPLRIEACWNAGDLANQCVSGMLERLNRLRSHSGGCLESFPTP